MVGRSTQAQKSEATCSPTWNKEEPPDNESRPSSDTGQVNSWSFRALQQLGRLISHFEQEYKLWGTCSIFIRREAEVCLIYYMQAAWTAILYVFIFSLLRSINNQKYFLCLMNKRWFAARRPSPAFNLVRHAVLCDKTWWYRAAGGPGENITTSCRKVL
jgi:hypothetical protein